MTNIVVLISGQGSNLQAIIESTKTCNTTGKVVGVISNRQSAPGLAFAAQAGIKHQALSSEGFENREHYDLKLIEIIETYKPDLIVLAGFMRILSAAFVRHYKGRLINIHPSLLPKFKGLNTHQKAIDAGEQEHGCSVHFVSEDLDGGPIIATASLKIEKHDDRDSLAKRVQVLEHKLYPKVVKWFSDGELKLKGEQSILANEALPKNGLKI